MDILIKKSEIIVNKKPITKNKEVQKRYIVYFLNDSDDIVFVGKKTGNLRDLDEYILEKSSSYFATNYYTEEVSQDEIANYHAELILKLNPIFNKIVPTNTKYISSAKAKDDYRIGKKEFMLAYKQYGGFHFGDSHYIEFSIFNDIYGISAPYSKNMPRIGATIVFEDQHRQMLDILYFGEESEYIILDENENGYIEQIKHKKYTISERYEALMTLLDDSFVVTEYIDKVTFKAKHSKTGKFHTFNTEVGGWNSTPPERTQSSIINAYKEKMNSI